MAEDQTTNNTQAAAPTQAEMDNAAAQMARPIAPGTPAATDTGPAAVASVDTPTEPPAPAETKLDPEEAHRKAQLAMEGEERTLRREEHEKEKAIKEEKERLNNELAVLAKEKEKLEIAWIDLDAKRQELKKQLDPIVKNEADVESKEKQIETEEANTAIPKEQEAIEKKKWVIEDERRKIEQMKWGVEEKLWQVEETLELNTTKYRSLLDEEDQLNQKIDNLDKGII